MSTPRNNEEVRQLLRGALKEAEDSIDKKSFLTPGDGVAWNAKGLFLIAAAILEVAEAIAGTEVDNDADPS